MLSTRVLCLWALKVPLELFPSCFLRCRCCPKIRMSLCIYALVHVCLCISVPWDCYYGHPSTCCRVMAAFYGSVHFMHLNSEMVWPISLLFTSLPAFQRCTLIQMRSESLYMYTVTLLITSTIPRRAGYCLYVILYVHVHAQTIIVLSGPPCMVFMLMSRSGSVDCFSQIAVLWREWRSHGSQAFDTGTGQSYCNKQYKFSQ